MVETQALIDWFTAAGVQHYANDEPTNFFQLKATKALKPQPEVKSTTKDIKFNPVIPKIIDLPATKNAEEIVANIDSTEALINAAQNFTDCEHKDFATNMLFAQGNFANKIIIISDYPNADDDKSGTIFSGAVGQLLDKMLAAIGMGRDNFYFVNACFWRPAGGVRPSDADIDMLRPFVNKLVELTKPKLVLALGGLGLYSVTGTRGKISQNRGRLIEQGGIKILPTFNPNHLLITPSLKKPTWNDLQAFKLLVDEIA